MDAGQGRRLSLNGPLIGTVAATAALQLVAVCSPPLRQVLRLTPLGPRDWPAVLGAAVLPLALTTRR